MRSPMPLLCGFFFGMALVLIPATLFQGCSTTQKGGFPSQYLKYSDADAYLNRAIVEATRRINFNPQCRAVFQELPDWPHKRVQVFIVPDDLSKTSPWVAKTLCKENGTAWVLVKAETIQWAILHNEFDLLVRVLIHEIAHVNQCPVGYVLSNKGKINGEELAELAEKTCDPVPVGNVPPIRDETPTPKKEALPWQPRSTPR